MELLTTNDFINLLKEYDPEGNLVLVFRTEGDCGGIMAESEVDYNDIDMTFKFKQQTAEGDVNVLRVTLRLDCMGICCEEQPTLKYISVTPKDEKEFKTIVDTLREIGGK